MLTPMKSVAPVITTVSFATGENCDFFVEGWLSERRCDDGV